MSKKKKRLGQLPPRYIFAINPHQDLRCSKCPKCDRATYLRKFPLLIHVDQLGPFVLGKTCRYCSKCEFIITHQDELESTLTALLTEREPTAIGNDYLVLATVEKKAWKQRLEQKGTMEEILAYTSDIKKYVDIVYEPAHWGFDGER